MSETEVEVEKMPTQLEVQTSLLGLESSEVEVEVEKIQSQLEVQTSLLGLESLEMEVEKIPIQLEVQTSLVVPVCLGAVVELQKTGAGTSRAE